MVIVCPTCKNKLGERKPWYDTGDWFELCTPCRQRINAALKAHDAEKYNCAQAELFDSAAPHDQDPTENNRELKKNRETNHRGKKMENR